MNIDFQTAAYMIGIGLVLILQVIRIIQFFIDRNKSAENKGVQEGKLRTEIDIMKQDIDSLFVKVRDIDTELSANKTSLTEIKADIKHILLSIDRMEKHILEGNR